MRNNDLFIVGIGSSAGGIPPLFDFFSHLTGNLNVAYVVVQHLDRNYKSQMKSILAKHTELPIFTIKGFENVKRGCIYLMPEKTKVYIEDNILILKVRGADEIINHAIDEFFISLSKDKREKSIGIILSGMGSDGTKGAIEIEQAGGIVIVQKPESAEFDSMTNSAIYNDRPDYILNPRDMGKYLYHYINSQKALSA